MTSIIRASSAATSGIIQTADASGDLALNGDSTVLLQSNGVTQATVSSTGLSTTNTINTPNTFGFKNRIINGAMVIDQRNAGASVTATADTYCVDRWAVGFGTTVNAFTAQQSTTVPSGFINSLLITAGTGASAGAAGYAYLRQIIEGLNVTDLGWGTANATTITISFWVRSSLTGTFGFVLRNSAANRAYGATFTISSANTFEYKTVTIPGDTGGTWLTTNGIGIGLYFDLGSGSNYAVTSGSWQAFTNALGVSGTTKLTATTGATFYITGVQLEVGSTATSFDVRDYGRELILCQRYYEYESGNILSPCANAGFSNSYAAATFFKVTKRTTPTVTIYSGAGLTGTAGSASWYPGSTVAAASLEGTSVSTFTVLRTGTSTYNLVTYSYNASAEL